MQPNPSFSVESLGLDSNPPAHQQTQQQTQQPQGQGAQPGDQATAEEWAEYLQGLENTNKELKGELDNVKKQASGTQQTFEELKKVLNPDYKPAGPDPDKIDEDFLDYVIDAAMEADKAGRGIPLTAQIAQRSVMLSKENRELRKQLGQIAEDVKLLKNPALTYDNQAYASIDSHTQNAIEQIFGKVDPHYYQMVSAKLSGQIQEIQQKNPDQWDQIRRSPQLQQRLSQYFVEQSIPPKAREILHRQQVMATPMTQDELWRAKNEAREQIKDPSERAKITKQIRQRMFEGMYGHRHR